MAKQKTKSIKDELKEQQDEVYGDTTISGTMPDPESDDDVEEIVEDAMGSDASKGVWQGDVPLDLQKEIEEDELEAGGWSVDDDEEE